MNRTLFDKRTSDAQHADAADDLWLGAEALAVADCPVGTIESAHAAATERDVDPSWHVV